MKHRKKRGSPDMLLIHEGVAMSVRERSRFPELLVHSLITVLGGFATMMCFQGFFGFHYDWKIMLAVFAGYSLIMLLLRQISLRIAFVGVLISLTVIPAMLLRHKDAAVVGVYAFSRVMNAVVNYQDPSTVDLSTAVSGNITEGDYLRFLFDLTVLAVAALLEYSDVLLLSRRSGRSGFVTRFLVTFPFLECGLFFGIETYTPAVFALVVFWVASLALVRVRVPKGEAREKHNEKKRRRKTFTSNEISAAYLVCIAVLLSGGILLFTRHHVRTKAMDDRRDRILTTMEHMSIRDFTEVLRRIPSELGFNVSGSEIELDEIDRLHFSGAPALDAVIGGQTLPEDLYLRGMVRGAYTGHGWTNPTVDYASGKSLFRRLTKAGRMPQTIFISDYAEGMRLPSGKFPVMSCEVSAVYDESVNYIPYQSVCDSGSKYRYDTEIGFKSRKNYSYWIFNSLRTDWKKMTETAHPSENADVREYEEFVRDVYRRVPDTEAMQKIETLFDEWMDTHLGSEYPEQQYSNLPLELKLDTIRDFLWDLCEYDTAPGKTPVGVDYADHFLFGSRRGFCAHYATTAVLLCRMCGIPARYVQGYVMTNSNLKGSMGSGGFLFEVPDDQAHAWAEIYVDSYGWMPYEFTEGVVEDWHRNDPQKDVTETTTAQTSVSYVSTQPSTHLTVSTAQSSTQSGAVTTAPQGGTGTAGKTVLSLLLILLLIAVLVMLWRMWHKVCVDRRSRMMHRKNPSLAADAAFQFIIRLLELQGIRQGVLGHGEFALAAEERCDLLAEGDMQLAVETEQQVVFSRGGINAEQAEQVVTLAERLASQLYEKSGRLRRFFLRWVLHIVM